MSEYTHRGKQQRTMSKIVIFLFVVLVASAIDASGTKDQLKSLQNRLESYFANEIDKIEEKYNTVKTIITEKSGILYNTNGNPIYAKASDNVYAIIIKAEEEVRELVIQTQNTSAPKDCDKMTRIFTMVTTFLAQVYDCISDELNVARERISVMESEYERLHSSLIDSRNKIATCHPIVDKPEEVDRAILCIQAIKNDTRSFIAKSIPRVFAKIDETNDFLSNRLQSRLTKCSNGYVGLRMEAVYLTGKAKMCYQQKIDEAAVRRSPTQ